MSVNQEDLDVDFVLQHFNLWLFVNENMQPNNLNIESPRCAVLLHSLNSN